MSSCGNCGAPMDPGSDGRTLSCKYCGKREQVAIEGNQIAAGLKFDLANADAFLARLATALGGSFADLTQVQREGDRVVSFEMNLDPDLFLVKRGPRGLVAQHKKMVRGIALKTTTVPLERWAEMLVASLASHANTSAGAAHVLERIRIG